ncbi:hypothetical protein [Microbacterium sp. No. 7]|uniref:hypothetical protein n=1 Tax=Microbacterium sp. No. 7 TaxID=1714373 RepID=UPI0006D29F54|nr:hypothetical protein [Microbacterium sp. No. 7]ALJ22067.1 hypothetical protein AOA12_20105 [Microbacterium sp. No. 7]
MPTERELAEDLAGALALLLYDAHPTYGSTAGWRGGYGGQVMTRGCSIIDPPPGAEWTQYDLLSRPLRAYMDARPLFDLDAARKRVRESAQGAADDLRRSR